MTKLEKRRQYILKHFDALCSNSEQKIEADVGGKGCLVEAILSLWNDKLLTPQQVKEANNWIDDEELAKVYLP